MNVLLILTSKKSTTIQKHWIWISHRIFYYKDAIRCRFMCKATRQSTFLVWPFQSIDCIAWNICKWFLNWDTLKPNLDKRKRTTIIKFRIYFLFFRIKFNSFKWYPSCSCTRMAIITVLYYSKQNR